MKPLVGILLLAPLLVSDAWPQAPARKPSIDQYGPNNWVDPDRSEPAGTHYRTFHSRTINADVSYVIYLPPDYETQTATRYPVVYFLHGSGSTPAKGAGLTAGWTPRSARTAPGRCLSCTPMA